MIPAVKSAGGCIPSEADTLLLQACLLGPQEAIHAWHQWKTTQTLDAMDEALHRHLPLLYRNLKDDGYEGADLPLLMGIYRQNWYVAQKLFHTVEGVLKQFRTAGIPTLLLKGLALSHVYYPDPYTRRMDDGDILVPVQYADAAIALLLNAGWQLQIALKKDYTYNSHGTSFIGPTGHQVDLHWRLFQDSLTDEDAVIWLRAVPLQFRSEPTLTLCATDHFLHTCIHGYMWNYMHSLRWVADAYLIGKKSSGTLDWRYLIEQAKERQYTLQLFKGLTYLRAQWKLDIPAYVLDELQKHPISHFERYEHHILTQLDRPRNQALRMAKQVIWELKKVWCLQYRLYPKQTLIQRILGFPAMLSIEMRLKSAWHFPAEGIKYLKRIKV